MIRIHLMFRNVNDQCTGKFRGKSGIGYHFQTTNLKRRKVKTVAVILKQTLRQTLRHTVGEFACGKLSENLSENLSFRQI
jgi:hypothetical protein